MLFDLIFLNCLKLSTFKKLIIRLSSKIVIWVFRIMFWHVEICCQNSSYLKWSHRNQKWMGKKIGKQAVKGGEIPQITGWLGGLSVSESCHPFSFPTLPCLGQGSSEPWAKVAEQTKHLSTARRGIILATQYFQIKCSIIWITGGKGQRGEDGGWTWVTFHFGYFN